MRRCLNHHHTVPHKRVNSVLRSTQKYSTVPDTHHIYVEIVFHVLSPLPGIPANNLQAVQGQLRHIVNSMNKDYSMQSENFDNALSTDELFQKPRGGAGAASADVVNHVNHAKYPSDEKIITNHNKSTQNLCTENIVLYRNYLQNARATLVTFINYPDKNILRLNSNVGAYTSKQSLDDASLTEKLDTSIKYEENGGSARIPQKLNIWIVQLPNTLLGYSTFPWDYPNKPQVDGVVISSNVSGVIFRGITTTDYSSFNRYKTYSHEVAHWTGLLHVFEGDLDFDPVTQSKDANGGEDFVADTPEQLESTQGNPYQTCVWPSDPTRPMNKHMFMNFLDYTDDIGMFMFTRGQAQRMRLSLEAFRSDTITIVDEQQPPQQLQQVPPGPMPSMIVDGPVDDQERKTKLTVQLQPQQQPKQEDVNRQTHTASKTWWTTLASFANCCYR